MLRRSPTRTDRCIDMGKTARLAGFQRKGGNPQERLFRLQGGQGPGKADFLRPSEERVDAGLGAVQGQAPEQGQYS